jgi:hypothetical protein
MNNQEQIAATIATQLGAKHGVRQIARFTGAKNFAHYGDNGTIRGGLSFRFPQPGPGAPNFVKITIDGSDLYTVEFGYVRGTKYTVKSTATGIYASMLRDLWWASTGLALSF